MSQLVDATAALSVDDERPQEFDAEPGVHIKLDKRGDGVAPVEGDTVQVNYSGRVKGKKTEFDKNDGGYPFEFTLGERKVVAGWESALPKLRVGDQVTLTLAPEFGYGEAGDSDDIPPNATLIFKVELVGIKDRTKGSGESDRERLAQLRAEREQAAAEAKAKKEALKAASADKQNALKEKLANKGKKGKGGGKKAWAPKAPKEKKSPKAKGKKTPA
mmetsp:Transcript_26083/g.73152  ORF Transcript_26083/g.73152 Transcript_26083/m.73152 type:complete len:217 (-) Transcript_26083:18-668(-)